MMKKIVVFMLILLSIIYVANAEICYQEYVNESLCGNSQNGTYQCFGSFQTGRECKYFYDGIWTTTNYAKPLTTLPTNIKIQMSYYIPLNKIVNDVKWQFRFLNQSLAYPYYNLTLPSGCYNNSYINVFTEVNGTIIYFSCYNYNNNSDTILFSQGGVGLNSRQLYEEGINWNLTDILIPEPEPETNYLGFFYLVVVMGLAVLFLIYRFFELRNKNLSIMEFVIECIIVVVGLIVIKVLIG